MVVKLRKAQKDYDKLPCTRNRQNKAYYEEIIDREIERVTKIEQEQAEKKQQKLL